MVVKVCVLDRVLSNSMGPKKRGRLCVVFHFLATPNSPTFISGFRGGNRQAIDSSTRVWFNVCHMNPPPVQCSPKPRLLPLALFTLLYVLAAVGGSIVAGNREFAFYIVVMLVLISVVMLVHHRMRLTGGQLWALSVWGLLHMAGGLVSVPAHLPVNGPIRVLYSLWIIPDLLKYDQVVHAFGFGVTTWICWHAIRASLRTVSGAEPRPSLGLMVLSAAAGMGFGALNEVIEFIAVLTIPNTNVGGYENTGWDLVANLAGCVTATVIIVAFGKKRRVA